MKFAYCIPIILPVLMLIACNTSETRRTNNNNCDSLFFGRPTKEVNVPLYEIDSSFKIYLDSIIEEEIKCTFYNPCQSGFLYYMRNFVFVPETNQRNSHSSVFYISSENIYTYDYSKCIGLFEYRSFRFICDSLCYKDILKKTNNSRKIKFLLISKKEPINDDRWSDWGFIIKNKKLQLFSHHHCYMGKERYPSHDE